MGLLNWLFGRRHSPEPELPHDLWDPAGMDRLLNEDLHQAIEAAAADLTPENRRRVYQLLQNTVYCIPTAGDSGEGKPLNITATQNESGERVLVAFTDPCALKRWAPDPPAFAMFPAAKLFELVLDNGFVQVLINPAGPAGGQLTRAEVESLARGELPNE